MSCTKIWSDFAENKRKRKPWTKLDKFVFEVFLFRLIVLGLVSNICEQMGTVMFFSSRDRVRFTRGNVLLNSNTVYLASSIYDWRIVI